MKFLKTANYAEMSLAGAVIIHEDVVAKLSQGEPFRLGLATGNTMIELYRILAEMFNDEKLDLSLLSTWNLDEYAVDNKTAVPHDHPLSYWRYMHENFFSLLSPSLGFDANNAHFPDPATPADYDRDLADAGGLDLQLLGIGFNGHIAFNEPEPDCDPAAFALRPTRALRLTPETIAQNTAVTANGDETLVPRYAATMGMRPILASRRALLLACFREQQEPLRRMLAMQAPSPALPASYLLNHQDCRLIWTADKIDLETYR